MNPKSKAVTNSPNGDRLQAAVGAELFLDCVHCGLCAERCPTGAWDMQKSTLLIPYASDEAAAVQQKAVAGGTKP